MFTIATVRMMRSHIDDMRTAEKYGWASNSKDKLLRNGANDLERALNRIEDLEYQIYITGNAPTSKERL